MGSLQVSAICCFPGNPPAPVGTVAAAACALTSDGKEAEDGPSRVVDQQHSQRRPSLTRAQQVEAVDVMQERQVADHQRRGLTQALGETWSQAAECISTARQQRKERSEFAEQKQNLEPCCGEWEDASRGDMALLLHHLMGTQEQLGRFCVQDTGQRSRNTQGTAKQVKDRWL